MKKCYICNKKGIKQLRIPVDIDCTYSLVWLCKDHLYQFNNREGIFDPYKNR